MNAPSLTNVTAKWCIIWFWLAQRASGRDLLIEWLTFKVWTMINGSKVPIPGSNSTTFSVSLNDPESHWMIVFQNTFRGRFTFQTFIINHTISKLWHEIQKHTTKNMMLHTNCAEIRVKFRWPFFDMSQAITG